MKKIDIKIETKLPIASNNDQISDIIDEALICFSIRDYLLEIRFVDEDEIAILNSKYRNITTATDILSFPQIDLPAQRVRFLGSLVISPAVVEKKDESIEDVLKHGLLHLLGYDHETDESKWETEAKKIDCNL
ncbi:MAG: rRNA maturation RNase YbeY [Candidatus Berkelbacteria bacterium]|nr:rRNA maturation RNase YbeY [Candidatus Berkelbacteria bacterium]